MTGISFSKKMSIQRPFGQPRQADDEYAITRSFESDRGRIINSAAIRRLQQKTQVFPLERNASVRSRLTHSMEVQQVGRYIAKEILNRLTRQHRLEELALVNYEGAFESLVEMACLMHDIGNPPFGHFGEAAINNWFRRHFDSRLASESPLGRYVQQISGDNHALKQQICNDLCHFEGNAQGIRIVYTLQKLNLTYAQTACILKYTRPAYLRDDDIPAGRDYLMKKPGYYLSEEPFVQALWQELGIERYCRHPLTYIMEAADDISYCIADLEDAVEKSILTTEELYHYLQEAWQKRRGQADKNDLFDRIVGEAKSVSQTSPQTSHRSKNDQFFMTLRVETINALVSYVAERFIANLADIYRGTFNQAILGVGKGEQDTESEECSLLEIYKSVAFQHVFRHDEVEQLELQGYRILNGLLDIYSPLLSIPFDDFNQLVSEDKHRDYPIETRLFHKLSSKHRQAYYQAIEQLQRYPKSERPLWEFYYRCRLVQDYISGMTDHYAYDEFRKLNAINL
jgi:dGTPase